MALTEQTTFRPDGKYQGCFRHGRSRSPEYRAYQDARQRCTNPNSGNYYRYGGRGIKFLFNDFTEFIENIGPRPDNSYSLHRIDNDGNYEPGNVKWATQAEQEENKTYADPSEWMAGNTYRAKTFVVEFPSGETQVVTNLKQFAREHGLRYHNLYGSLDGRWQKTHRGFKVHSYNKEAS